MPVRLAQLKDASECANVHMLTWQTAYRGIIPDDYLRGLSLDKKIKAWNDILRKNFDSKAPSFHYVATTDQDHVVGFCGAGVQRGPDIIPNYDSELFAIYILQENQNQGLGQALVYTAVSRLFELGFETMVVWALKENPYRRFYEKLGGTLIAEKSIKIANRDFIEVAYGWQQIREILKK